MTVINKTKNNKCWPGCLKGEHLCSIGGDVNWWNHCENSMEVLQKIKIRDFPGGPVAKNPPANSGDMGSKLA